MSTEAERIEALLQEREALERRLAALTAAGGAHPVGHFYSPVPGEADITARVRAVRAKPAPRTLPGIDLAEQRQLDNLRRIAAVVGGAVPFPDRQDEAFRYFFENTQYGYNDAIILHGMLRIIRPRRIIEIGSGFSSAVMLDTNDRFLDGRVACTFIEPYPERLQSILRPDDRDRCRVEAVRVQDVDPGIFATLGAGDILFVDSSHVVKYGSDLEYIFREVLPGLAGGTYIHFHDVFYPFEYPPEVLALGHFWNECYVLRAFLTNNSAYRIELFGDFIAQFHRAELETISPLCLKNTGAHFWMSKI